VAPKRDRFVHGAAASLPPRYRSMAMLRQTVKSRIAASATAKDCCRRNSTRRGRRRFDQRPAAKVYRMQKRG
jgi:hypothetical protein